MSLLWATNLTKSIKKNIENAFSFLQVCMFLKTYLHVLSGPTRAFLTSHDRQILKSLKETTKSYNARVELSFQNYRRISDSAGLDLMIYLFIILP